MEDARARVMVVDRSMGPWWLPGRYVLIAWGECVMRCSESLCQSAVKIERARERNQGGVST